MRFRANVIWLAIWVALAVASGVLDAQGYHLYTGSSGMSVTRTLTILFAILGGYHLGALSIKASVKIRRGAPGEVNMLSGLLRAATGIAVIAAILALFGLLGTVGAALGAISGLILGWSLQAPVSGVAAWIMVSLMRPFASGTGSSYPLLGWWAMSSSSLRCTPSSTR